jgi:bacillithiol system protein YtxJ
VTTFRTLASEGDLDAVLAASHGEPVIVFKHSQSCGVSLMARDDLAGGVLPAPVHEVVVQRHRDVSNGLAARLGVRHASPQAFVVARGAATWHSSHHGVTPHRIATAWRQAADAFTPTPAGATC